MNKYRSTISFFNGLSFVKIILLKSDGGVFTLQ